MLKPKYIEQLPAAMVELYSEVEQDIGGMARRIAAYDYWIPAAEHQRKALIELGNFHSYVIKALSARTGKTTAELERLMEEAGLKALSFDVAVYRSTAGPSSACRLQRIAEGPARRPAADQRPVRQFEPHDGQHGLQAV